MKNKGNYKKLNGEIERSIYRYKETHRVAEGQNKRNNDGAVQIYHNMRQTKKQEESTQSNTQVDLQMGFPRAIEHI